MFKLWRRSAVGLVVLVTSAGITGIPAAATAPIVVREHVRVVDLGTLGGLDSYAAEMNGSGQVVGISTAANGVFHGYFWERGLMRDLGPGWTMEIAVNEHGVVAGDRIIEGRPRAYMWRRGMLRDIGSLGGSSSRALDINNHEQIVGMSDLPGDTGGRAFLWQGGRITQLGALKGGWSIAEAINDNGVVVGESDFAAFVWSRGSMRALPTLPGATWSEAQAIDNLGRILGVSMATDGLHAVQWWHDRVVDLGLFSPKDQNARGEVIGNVSRHAFLVRNATWTDLGSLTGLDTSATALNNRGWIVGASRMVGTATNHAFLWRHNRMTDLGTLPGGLESYAVDVNDRGQILGASSTAAPGGHTHAVIWQVGMRSSRG